MSKTFPIQALREAYEAGQRDFGENKVQEALQKMEAGADMQIGWHLIGHLQSNKAKKAAGRADWIHAIDSVDLLRRVDEAASAAGRVVDVLVQVDLALEPTKHGAAVDQVPAILQAASRLQRRAVARADAAAAAGRRPGAGAAVVPPAARVRATGGWPRACRRRRCRSSRWG